MLAPPPGELAPPREILDPPLVSVIMEKLDCIKNICVSFYHHFLNIFVVLSNVEESINEITL